MKNKIVYPIIAIILIVLIAFFLFRSHTSPAASNKVEKKGILESISSLDEGLQYAHGLFIENPEHIVALMTQENLVFKNKEGQMIKQIALPKDKFYLAVAPFKEHTHNCTIHNFSMCKGEMPGRVFDVKVTDKKKKSAVLEEKVTTLDNGFFELWLDRGKDYFIEVSDESRAKAVGSVATFDDSKTCITDLKLR